MKNPQPIFDPSSHYRIELRGQVDVEWLKSFDNSAEISSQGDGQREDITVLTVHTDESGIIGLVRSLYGLGLTIQQFQVVPCKE